MIGTLRELFAHNDWARGKLMKTAAACSDEALDRPFEMGEGSLRKTLVHLWEAEDVWLGRWQSRELDDRYPLGMDKIAAGMLETATRRNAWLDEQDDASLGGTLHYRRRGEPRAMPLGISLLHVTNHGVHHRAQALNMLRQVGVDRPTLDYVIMRLTDQQLAMPLDVATIRTYFEHGDWAQRRLHQAAAALDQAARRREFPMGPGSLHKAMRHIADATLWWLGNIHNGPGQQFPATIDSESWPQVWDSYEEGARARDAYLASLGDEELTRVVEGSPRPDIVRRFPLGVVLLQLCTHATHHRAQALNMCRHLGGEVVELDVGVWQLQKQAAEKK